jgi:hypothetical protein
MNSGNSLQSFHKFIINWRQLEISSSIAHRSRPTAFSNVWGVQEHRVNINNCRSWMQFDRQSFLWNLSKFEGNELKMSEPSELSLKEIHEYFLRNNYRVTNTHLVKYFRRFLTGPQQSKCFQSWLSRCLLDGIWTFIDEAGAIVICRGSSIKFRRFHLLISR